MNATNLLPKEFEPDPAAASLPWLAARCADALEHFRAAGIPHRRVEEWKYTDLRNALEGSEAARQAQLRPGNPFAAISANELVIRNGRFEPASSDVPGGIELFDLSSPEPPDWVKLNLGELIAKRPMGDASLALMRGGLALRIAGDLVGPLHLRISQDSDTVHSRVLIVIERGAFLTLLESHAAQQGFANIGMEIVLGVNAGLTHLRLADAAPDAIQVEEIGIRLARDARYCAHFGQAGARLSRLELAATLLGEGAEVELSGTGVLWDKLHADVTTHIEHVAGKTASRQLFKYVVGGNARGVYQGKISVHKGADGSDSRQTAKALLLGERAEADLKPELEILADDVKCAHGAAVGELDADSLFYLRSRGIAESEARALLTRAFLEEAVEGIVSDDLRRAVWDFTERALGSEP